MHTNTLLASKHEVHNTSLYLGTRIPFALLFLIMAPLGFHVGSVAASPITIGGYSLISGQAPQTFTDTSKTLIASRFTVGAGNVTVNSVNYFGRGNGTTNPSIAIYSAKASAISGGFEPDALITGATGTFLAGPSTTAFTPTTTNFTFPITLTAATNYYVVVQGTLNTSIYTPAAGQSGQFSVIDNGLTPQLRELTYNGTAWASFSSSSFIPYALVQGGSSEVPEPATSLLMVMGLALLGITRRIASAKS